MADELFLDPPDREFNQQQLLLGFLDEFDLDTADLCLDMGVPLFYAGIRENGDVDFIIHPAKRDAIFERARDHPDCRITRDEKLEYKEDIELVQPERYDIFGIRDEEIVSNPRYHTVVDGFKITRLELVLSLKYAQGRLKDRADIRAIEESGYVDSDTWDWDLVHTLPPWERTNTPSFLERTLMYYDSWGLLPTLRKGWEVLSRNVSLISRLNAVLDGVRRLSTAYRDDRRHRRGLEYHLDLAHLLSAHYDGEEFTGWDLILTCALRSNDSLREYLPEHPAGLVESDQSGRERCTVNSDFQVVAGRKSIARTLTDERETVPVSIESGSRDRRYDERWVDSLDLGRDRREQLSETRFEVFDSNGAFFYAFVWPSVSHVADEVVSFLADDVRVVSTADLALHDDFGDFLLSLYDVDHTVREWILRKKVHGCQTETNTVRVVVFELPDPAYDFSSESPVSERAKSLKDRCRKRFYEDVDEYVYDNVVHITDNYTQNRHARDVVQSFADRDGVERQESPNQNL